MKKIEGAPSLHWFSLTCPCFRYLSYLSFYYGYQGIQIITGSMVLLLKKGCIGKPRISPVEH